jgi:hypothetical protein
MPTPDDPRDHHSIEPDVLDQDMTASDIAFTLEHLSFRANGLGVLKLDRPVRDFLVSALRRNGLTG